MPSSFTPPAAPVPVGLALVPALVLGIVVGCARPTASQPIPAAPVANSVVVHKPAKPVIVDYKTRGYFYASAPIDEGLGGHSTSANVPQRNGLEESGSGVYARVYLDEGKTLAKGYDAIRVVIVNGTGKPVKFDASDARLYVVQEAIGPDGKWAPIEYLPTSSCGNSYHTLTLPANAHWEFLAPRYDGAFATKLRVKVSLDNGYDPGLTTVFYSNEFAGRINLAQFTVEQGHTATNIMDPYNN
ncbi:MAG: hypothetical protein ACKV2T_43345 [Kofleriaceae bacterium]